MAVTQYATLFLTYAIMAAFGTFLLSLVGVALFYLYKFVRYKIKVDIYEKVGDYYIHFDDLAREIVHHVEDGTNKTYLMLRRGVKGLKKVPLPDSVNYVPSGSKKKLNLLLKDGFFSPLPIKENSPEALTASKEGFLASLLHYQQEIKEANDMFRPVAGFWDKYGGYIMPFTVMFFNFILWLILFMQIKGGGGGGGVTQVIS